MTEKDRLVGYIDLLGGGLTVLGWAWFEQDPERRADIEFLINGEVAGSAIADRHRPDVEQAGRGDGRYGFAWPLAFAVLPVAEEIVISARDRASRQELANAIKLSAGDLLARLKEFAARSEPGERKLAALRAAARLAPDDPWHALTLAEALRRDGQPEAAEAALRALLDQHPHFWHAHVALGNLARAGNDPSRALAWYRAAAELAPSDVWRWLDVATELRALNRIEEALAALARAEEVAPQDLAPRLGLIMALRSCGAVEAARRAGLSALTAHPDQPQLLVELGRIECLAGDAAAAARWFEAALTHEPENMELLAELARQEYLLGRLADSQTHWRRVLALDPGHAEAARQLASQALAQGNAGLAEEIYRAAALRRPGEPEFRLGMLDALAWQGRLGEAMAGLNEFEAEAGTTPTLACWRITWLRRVGKMEEALHVARAAALATPKEFWLGVERFQTELLAGTQAGASLFAVAPATPGERAVKRRCVGALAESLWQLPAALGHYEAAAALNPDDPATQEALARVKMMSLNLDGARAHLRRLYELAAAGRRLRGESLNISQSLLGQMIEEYGLDDGLARQLAALAALPAPERLEPLAKLVQRAPDSTAPAASLLLAMRQAERLEFHAQPEAAPIPPLIHSFWHISDTPGDVEMLMQSWRERNPGHEWRLCDEETALAYIGDRFPPPVSQAFRRVRELTQKADIFRLAALVEEGGVYADADDRCLRPLTALLPAGADLVLAQEEFGCAGNHFIAATPRHPVLKATLEAVVEAVNRGDNDIPWLLSGPGALTRALAEHLAMRDITAGLPPGLALLDKTELGRAVAGGCFATYKLPRPPLKPARAA